MKRYKYRAANADGRVVTGHMMAANENDLSRALQSTGLELIAASQNRSFSSASFSTFKMTIPRQRQMASYFQQTSDLLRCGHDISAALTYSLASLDDAKIKDRMTAILRDLNNGEGLSKAFAQQNIFDPVVVSVLKTGETSGKLQETFETLARKNKSESDVRHKLNKALRYPAFLLIVSISAITFTMGIVVPQIVGFLESISDTIPLSTRLLIYISDLFSASAPSALALAAMAWLAHKILLHTIPETKPITDRLTLCLPIFGKPKRMAALARFTSSLSLLLRVGLDLTSALEISIPTLGNLELRRIATQSLDSIKIGKPFSTAFAQLYGPAFSRTIALAEKTGRLTETLETMAHIIDDKLAESIDSALGSLEPILTTIVGAILAWVFVAVLGPLYGSLNAMTSQM